MTRECQNCKTLFEITEDDLSFYERIKVPPPTFCPECRLIRRFSHTNVINLYKRVCDLCKKEVVSRYSPDKEYTVYCPHCWWGDKWDPMEYGKEYDFSRSFFEQFNELWHKVPLLGLSLDLKSAIESPYTNDAGSLKQCYLIFQAELVERSAYGFLVVRCSDCMNCSFLNSCELSYDLFHCYKVYQGIYLLYTVYTNNSAFLWQCENCQNCFGSANLRNKQYHIFNKPYTKDGYFSEIEKFDLGSYKNYTEMTRRAREHWLKYPVRTHWQELSVDSTGLLVFESKNCQKCFEVSGGVEDCKYTYYIGRGPVKDSYDYSWWGNNAELIYEGMTVGGGIRNVHFADESGLGLYDAEYVKLSLGGSSNLFGCVSLNKKSYCILNKQYSKEEYEKLVPQIIQHMKGTPYIDKKGRKYFYGEFFPTELSPFAYNETLAQQYYPLAKEEALTKGYSWKDQHPTEYKITLPAGDLPDHIRDVSDLILKETIGCLVCGHAFRIIPQELDFHRKMNVPLPRSCFQCRLQEKIKDQPVPTRLFKRTCQCSGKGSENEVYENSASHFHGTDHCPNEFETSYAPNRPEIVYCKECYQAEVI